jgi:hypothetical protein
MVFMAIEFLIALPPYAAMARLAGVVIVVAVVLLLPAVRRAIFAPTRSAGDDESNVRPMQSRGLVAAYIVIVLIIGGSLFDMLRDTEHWPWSNFPMYSRLGDKGATFQDYRLYGVPKANPLGEFSLSTDGRFTQPFDTSRLAEALAELANDPHLHQGIEDCLRRYENLRKAGAHDGPEISALRLYRVTFKIDPYGRNTQTPEEKSFIDQAVVLPTGVIH